MDTSVKKWSTVQQIAERNLVQIKQRFKSNNNKFQKKHNTHRFFATIIHNRHI